MSIGHGILQAVISDQNALYQAYMNFIEGGGLFVPTQREYKLGDEVFMLLTLPDESDKIPVAGKIVWITPKGGQGGRQPGIGVQFSERDNGKIRARIENALGGLLKSDKPTHTL